MMNVKPENILKGWVWKKYIAIGIFICLIIMAFVAGYVRGSEHAQDIVCTDTYKYCPRTVTSYPSYNQQVERQLNLTELSQQAR